MLGTGPPLIEGGLLCRLWCGTSPEERGDGRLAPVSAAGGHATAVLPVIEATGGEIFLEDL